MYYYVYRIDFEDGHYYIGSHKSKNKNLNDNYFGTGYILWFMHNYPNIKFKKTIISLHENRQDAYKAESKLIIPKRIDNMSLNIKKTTWGYRG